MVRPDRFLADDEKERVLRAVKDAELRTAGEIRVLIAGRSTPRAWIPPVLVGLVSAAVAYWIQHSAAWGYPGSVEALISVTVGSAVALALAWLVPPSRKAKDRAVWKRARREFARLGIGKTSGSTGVLVMLSLWEHEAVVLADKAINEKVPPDTWSREVKILLDGVKAGKPGEGIAAAVTEIGALLATHFPRRDDDVNELPDAVETGK